jgi:hypothetical protein
MAHKGPRYAVETLRYAATLTSRDLTKSSAVTLSRALAARGTRLRRRAFIVYFAPLTLRPFNPALRAAESRGSFRLWHLADMTTDFRDVCFWG